MKAQDSNAARLIRIYEVCDREYDRRIMKGWITLSDLPEPPIGSFKNECDWVTYGQIERLLNTIKLFRRSHWLLTYDMFKPWVISIVGFHSMGTCQTSADYDCVLDYVLKCIRDPNISRSAERVDRTGRKKSELKRCKRFLATTLETGARAKREMTSDWLDMGGSTATLSRAGRDMENSGKIIKLKGGKVWAMAAQQETT